jgi:hypothetical protein
MRPLTAFLGFMLALLIDGPAQDAYAAGKPLALAVRCQDVVEGLVATCTFSTSGGNGRPVTITWVAKSNTATAGQDFPALWSGTAQVSNKSPFVLHLPTTEDAIVEGDEYAAIEGTVTSGSVHPSARAMLKIIDNDVGTPPPPPIVCPDGTTLPAGSTCPPTPPPPPAPGELAYGGRAKGMMACQSLSDPNDETVVGATYTVVGFAGRATSNDQTGTTASRDYVILNDASHWGDGWFGITVPTGCVEAL